MKLTLDNRTGNLNRDTECDNCDREVLIEYLNKLNGNNHTLLSIEREDSSRLDVGGGPNCFIVSCTTSNDENLTLLNLLASNSMETIELCVGGQFADFPKPIVVNKETAINAVLSFSDKNEQDLDWDKE